MFFIFILWLVKGQRRRKGEERKIKINVGKGMRKVQEEKVEKGFF